MSRSGDAFVTSDQGRFYLHLSPLAGGIKSLSQDEADRYVTDAGLHSIDESFDSWSDVDASIRSYASEHVPTPKVDPAAWDEQEVDDMIAAAKRMITRDEAAKAKRLLDLLLGLPLVRGDDDLFAKVQSELRVLTEPPTTVSPPFASSLPVATDARRRWSDLLVAA